MYELVLPQSMHHMWSANACVYKTRRGVFCSTIYEYDWSEKIMMGIHVKLGLFVMLAWQNLMQWCVLFLKVGAHVAVVSD